MDLGLGRERTDDSGAGGAVSADVALGVGVDPRLAVLAGRDDDRALHLADERMAGLDA